MYGVLILSLAYAVFAVLVHRLSPLCLDEPCNSEGVNNSTSGFVTDYFLSLSFALFAIHLSSVSLPPSLSLEKVQEPQVQVVVSPSAEKNKSSIRALAVAVQVGFALAYLLGALAHQLWANSGLDDSMGQPGFYLSWIFAYSSEFVTACCQYVFVAKVTAAQDDGDKDNSQRLRSIARYCLGANSAATALIVGGCIGSLVSSQVDLTSDLIDAAPDADETPTTVTVFVTGEILWFFVNVKLRKGQFVLADLEVKNRIMAEKAAFVTPDDPNIIRCC